MPFADIDDVRLFYTDEGRGDPAVLLVHGWTCDSHDWDWQIPAFAARHRVIAVDLRGHGHSSVPEAGYTPRGFAADLAALIEQLGTGPVVAIGHSLGGVIVSALAVERPELVQAVVAVDPAYGVAGPSAAYLDQVLAGLRGPAAFDVAVATFAAMEVATTPPQLVALHRRRLLALPVEVIVDTLAGIYEPEDQIGRQAETERYFVGRSCPVLSVHASQARADWDATTSTHSASRHIAWESVGHWLHQERSEEFNALALGWIAGLPGQQAAPL